MTKLRTLVATIALLVMATLPLIVPVGAEQFSERAKKIGFRLNCMCGSCNMTVTGCSHPGGEFSGPCQAWAQPALQEIDRQLTQGKSEQQVIDSFAAQYGPTIYAEPPKSGFSLVAWVMPTAYLVLGTLVVIFVISRWMKKNASEIPASSGHATSVSPEILERARKLAQQETEE